MSSERASEPSESAEIASSARAESGGVVPVDVQTAWPEGSEERERAKRSRRPCHVAAGPHLFVFGAAIPYYVAS